MLRESVIVLVVAAAVSSAGCSKKNDDGTKAGAGGSSGATAPAVGAKNGVNWEKVQRVPFAKLQSLLPDAPLGFKRTDLRGQTVPDGESTYSEGAADYEGANETGLTLTVQDHPVGSRDSIASKTTTFKGHPVVGESEGSDEAELRIVVAERFMIIAHGRKLKVAQLKSVVEKMDLAKLASWKLEGVK
jgi:hypothetical protein